MAERRVRESELRVEDGFVFSSAGIGNFVAPPDQRKKSPVTQEGAPVDHLIETLIQQDLTPVGLCNLFTKTVAAKADARQLPGAAPSLPSPDASQLLADLVLEEAKELLAALGFRIAVFRDTPRTIRSLAAPAGSLTVRLIDVIDGACDLQFVANGVLTACGVADLRHIEEVCRANRDKFPDFVPLTDPKTGKYLKPDGWVGPDHLALLERSRAFSLRQVGETFLTSLATSRGPLPTINPPVPEAKTAAPRDEEE